MLPLPFIIGFFLVPGALCVGGQFLICVHVWKRWKCAILPVVSLFPFIPGLILVLTTGGLTAGTASWLALLLLGTGLCMLAGCAIGAILYRKWRKRTP